MIMEDFEILSHIKALQEIFQLRQQVKQYQEVLRSKEKEPKNNARKSKLHNSDSD